MNFTQVEFILFLVVVLTLAWSLRSVVWRNGFLLAASYYFYAYWDVRFCGLLLTSTLVDFVVAQRISRSQRSALRRSWMMVSVAVNLGMLGFFKYFNFFIESAAPIVRGFGFETTSLNIILPVGISFFTFQTLSYTIDVYRGKITPTHSLLNFALYVAFFPQLVAGPIVRAANLLPQLTEVPPLSRRRFYGGFQQLLRGAVKKVLIADRLSETVDVVFAGPELYSSVTVWIAVIAYSGQIYYDFSGYSDMAIGVAKMLGYRFPVNFRHPYLAKSMSEFWRRWHITLSTWLRDYLYIPLGGSRGSSSRTQTNLLLTMSLGGLWHGASPLFLLWGVWHGLALIVLRAIPSSQSGQLGQLGQLTQLGQSTQSKPSSIRNGLAWVTTMTIVMMGWVLFRSPDVATSLQIYQRIWWPFAISDQPFRILWLPPLTLLAIALMVFDHSVWTTRLRRCMRLPWDAWYSPVVTAIMLWALVLYAPKGFRPFVYFQF